MKDKPFSSREFQKKILHWYDRNRRALPWRALSGVVPDPYHVWLSEVMLQQTTVPAVIPYFIKFIRLWPTVHDLAQADPDEVMREWAGLGYYARARNLLKCAKKVSSECGGIFPSTVEELIQLPGVGPYTAAAIAAIAFNREETVIDANIERVAARVFAIKDTLPKGKSVIRAEAQRLFSEIGPKRAADFPQALMDLGAAICTAGDPVCGMCPVSEICLAKQFGIQRKLPARAKKAEKPIRKGQVFLLQRKNGDVLVEKRDENRMLGGMLGLPTTDWDLPKGSDKNSRDLEFWKMQASNLASIGEVRHSFTHFTLYLEVWRGDLPFRFRPLNKFQSFLGFNGRMEKTGLPTVFGKVIKFLDED